jgi:protease IV
VTASDMMYRDLLAFKARAHKPVIVEMLDVCASGGYYVSCAADYRMAYPTTITGSIGVIIQTLNFSERVSKLGISAKAITSRENKDMGSPLRPMTANDEKLLKALVDQFYAQFCDIVRHSPERVADKDWSMVTDGRVFTGRDAVRLGLIDRLGSLDDAIAEAKHRAGISRAKLIMYTHMDSFKGSAYAQTPVGGQEINLLNLNVDTSGLLPSTRPEFLYLWNGR